MRKLKILMLFLGLMILVAAPVKVMATPITFNLTAGGDFGAGNKGWDEAATKDSLTLTLSALTMIPDGIDNIYPTTSDTAGAGGSTSTTKGFYGTVYIDYFGAGVQGWEIDKDKNIFKSPLTIDGSYGISGKGAHEDEALILTFSGSVLTSSVRIYLNDYEPYKVDKEGNIKNEDAALIYVGSPVPLTTDPSLSEADIEAKLVNVSDKLWYLDLGLFPTLPTTLTQIVVRANGESGVWDYEKGHFYVSSVQATPVPEPATMLLLGAGLIGLAGFARKKFRK